MVAESGVAQGTHSELSLYATSNGGVTAYSDDSHTQSGVIGRGVRGRVAADARGTIPLAHSSAVLDRIVCWR